MKRNNINIYIAILLITAIIFSFLTIYVFGEQKHSSLSTSASSAVLYQPETDEFLYSKNADERLPMASTTKIMTALVALEESNFSDIVHIDSSAIGTEGSSAYLRSGDVLTMEELIYALLLQSANDAAVAIACHISGSVPAFADLMNEKVASLNLSNTHFTNPHGLDDKDHYTTARDLAIIASAALKNESFKNIVSTYKKVFSSEGRSRTYINHNKLLNMYDGCVGVKTGFTKKSGRCLVGAAERDGLTFITVTLDAPEDWNDHSVLLDYGYKTMEKVRLAEPFDHIYRVPVIGAKFGYITVANTVGAEFIRRREMPDAEEHIKLVRYVVAPVKRGDILGEIIYTQNGEELTRVSLVATDSIEKQDKTGLLYKILSIFD